MNKNTYKMNIRNLFFLFIIIISFTLLSEVSESNDNKRIEILESLMPKEINSIYIGMDKEVLFKARPLAKPMKMFDSKPLLWLEENIKSAFFDKVIYGFSNNGKLEGVSLFIETSAKHVKKYTPYFLKGCLKKWGSNYEIIATRIRHSKRNYEEASLVWRKKIATIVISYTPEQHLRNGEKCMMKICIIEPGANIEKGIIGVINSPKDSTIDYIQDDLKKAESLNETDTLVFN